MPSFSRGQKAKLTDVTTQTRLVAGLDAQAPGLTLDFSCFGVDANNWLSDDRYFVFFNQPESPEGAIKQSGPREGDSQSFEFDLSRLPDTVAKLIFVVTIDGEGTLAQLETGHFRLLADETEVMRFDFNGNHFSGEVASMVAEVYLKDVWRVAAVGQGFSGGLAAVLNHFGGQESEEDAASLEPAPEASTPPPSTPTQIPTAPKVSLDKDQQLQLRLESQAPALANLSQTLAVSLKKSGLQELRARVALVLDASGSMRQNYKEGAVQAVVSRIATLALRLDDDDELDVWAYGVRHTRLPSVTLDTIKGYVNRVTRDSAKDSIIGDIGLSNNEPPVIQEVFDYYRDSPLPALVVFVSDGGVKSSGEIKRLMTEASAHPIFWQFVGLGGRNYGILEQLDTMAGRTVDNANFFHVDDLYTITEEDLYNRLLNEFPSWLRAAKTAGILT